MENLNTQLAAHTVTLEPSDAKRLATLCGQFDEHLRQIEHRLKIEIRNRGNVFALYGDNHTAQVAGHLLRHLYQENTINGDLTPDQVHLAIQQSNASPPQH